MKNRKTWRLISLLLALVMVVGLCASAPAEAASKDDRYDGDYNASTILSSYSLFVRENLESRCHILSSIAVR